MHAVRNRWREFVIWACYDAPDWLRHRVDVNLHVVSDNLIVTYRAFGLTLLREVL